MITLEIILWIAAGLIISEVIFIIWTKKAKKNADYKMGISNTGDYFGRKILSLFFGGFFTFIQYTIVFITKDGFNEIGNYERLIYEVLIIGFLVLFFYINKKISDKILNENGGDKKESKQW